MDLPSLENHDSIVDHSKCEETIAQLTQEILQLQSKSQVDLPSSNAAPSPDLFDEISHLQSQLQEITLVKSSLEQKVSELSVSHEALEKSLIDTKAELTSAKEDYLQLKETCNELDQLQDTLRSASAERDRLDQALAQCNDDLSKAQRKVALQHLRVCSTWRALGT